MNKRMWACLLICLLCALTACAAAQTTEGVASIGHGVDFWPSGPMRTRSDRNSPLYPKASACGVKPCGTCFF